MSALIGIILSLLLIPFHGDVLSELWGWFLVPIGLPAIGVIHALGLRLTLYSFCSSLNPADPPKENPLFQALISIVITLFIWGFGALYHWGMM